MKFAELLLQARMRAFSDAREDLVLRPASRVPTVAAGALDPFIFRFG